MSSYSNIQLNNRLIAFTSKSFRSTCSCPNPFRIILTERNFLTQTQFARIIAAINMAPVHTYTHINVYIYIRFSKREDWSIIIRLEQLEGDSWHWWMRGPNCLQRFLIHLLGACPSELFSYSWSKIASKKFSLFHCCFPFEMRWGSCSTQMYDCTMVEEASNNKDLFSARIVRINSNKASLMF